MGKHQNTITALRQAARERESIEEIAKAANLKVSSVKIYSYVYKINLPNDRLTTEERISYFQDAFANGQDIFDLAEHFDLSPAAIITFARRHNIKLPKNSFYVAKRNPIADSLIQRGATTSLIALALGGRTRERARQYIHGIQQYETWINAKEKNGLESRLSQSASLKPSLAYPT